MPASLQRSEDLAEFKRRIAGLEPDTRGLWGTMDAHQMLCHVSDQIRVALGDLPTKDRSSLFTRTVLPFLIIRLGMEPPKGKVKTAPEMKTTGATDWEADREALYGLMDRMAVATETTRHPMFGLLSAETWGLLSARHLDYHLRQFGA
ncbi:MAG: DUF1569 domain-containing protein [Thermoanaerobaculia bacterium]|nr:DUF1569 domain-containing protein [Thermoanaerobaculia bacterium]